MNNKINKSKSNNILSYLYILVPLIILLSIFYPWTDEVGAKKTLEKNGYKVLNVGGHYYWTTDKNLIKTKFVVISSKGDTCNGYVTKNLFGKNTICIDE